MTLFAALIYFLMHAPAPSTSTRPDNIDLNKIGAGYVYPGAKEIGTWSSRIGVYHVKYMSRDEYRAVSGWYKKRFFGEDKLSESSSYAFGSSLVLVDDFTLSDGTERLVDL